MYFEKRDCLTLTEIKEVLGFKEIDQLLLQLCFYTCKISYWAHVEKLTRCWVVSEGLNFWFSQKKPIDFRIFGKFLNLLRSLVLQSL